MVAEALRSYTLLAWTWVRAAAQYPLSLALLSLSSVAVSLLDLAGIAVLFAHAPRIAGFTAAEVMFLWATASLSFTVSDVLTGTTERLGQHVREGSLDAMLVRPVSPLIQVATEDFSPRRLARLIPMTAVLVIVIARLDVPAARLALLPVMLVSGTVIFIALWVLTSSAQFVLVEIHPATKAITYGGAFATQYPMSMYARDYVRGLTFVVPLAFVNWQPTLFILDKPDPLGLPGFLRFASPVVAVLLCGPAALAWRAGLRHYRSTGS